MHHHALRVPHRGQLAQLSAVPENEGFHPPPQLAQYFWLPL